MRISDHTEVDVDGGSSPHLRHIFECITIIDEMEADKKGTDEEKTLDSTEKYKFGLMYMKMLENPRKFSHLDRFVPSEETNKVQVRLSDEDMISYKKLQAKLERGREKIEQNKKLRRKVIEKGRAKSVLPEKQYISALSAPVQADRTF